MEHPHLWSGLYIPEKKRMFNSTGLYQVHSVRNVPVMGKLTLAESVFREERLLNWCASIHPASLLPSSAGVQSLKSLIKGIERGRLPKRWKEHVGTILGDLNGIAAKAGQKLLRPPGTQVFKLNHMAEQVPNPDSRVVLSTERDALGQPRANLDWRVTAQDMRSMIRAQEIVDEELRLARLGRLQIDMKDDTPPEDLHGGWHHMGTTRMHLDPRRGVVDENSRVHGMANLFIAGPSVFPTGGVSNPVLTFVALTLRLADHIKGQMGP